MLEAVARLTRVKSPKFVPEIRLHCVVPKEIDYPFYPDDYNCMWGYPTWNGIAISRFILDNPQTFNGQSLVDLGSGSGIVSIAAAKSGAKVTAIDADVSSVCFTQWNCELNNVDVEVKWGSFKDVGDGIVVMSSLFYDKENLNKIQLLANGKKVILGGKIPEELSELKAQFKPVNINVNYRYSVLSNWL